MKLFKVTAHHICNKEQAKILENLLNQPGTVDRIMAEVTKVVQQHMEFIVTGYPRIDREIK